MGSRAVLKKPSGYGGSVRCKVRMFSQGCRTVRRVTVITMGTFIGTELLTPPPPPVWKHALIMSGTKPAVPKLLLRP